MSIKKSKVSEIEKEIGKLKTQIEKEGLTKELDGKLDNLGDEIDRLEDSGELSEEEAEKLDDTIDVLGDMDEKPEAKAGNTRNIKKIVSRIEGELEKLKKQIEEEGMTNAIENKLGALSDELDELENSGELPEEEAEKLDDKLDVIEDMDKKSSQRNQ